MINYWTIFFFGNEYGLLDLSNAKSDPYFVGQTSSNKILERMSKATATHLEILIFGNSTHDM